VWQWWGNHCSEYIVTAGTVVTSGAPELIDAMGHWPGRDLDGGNCGKFSNSNLTLDSYLP
jgi:hypothetical protein